MRNEAKTRSLVPTMAAVAAAGFAPALALGVLFTAPGAAADSELRVAPASTSSVIAMPTGCTNLSGGSGSPNNGTHPGGTGTGAGAGNFNGGMIGSGVYNLDAMCSVGGSASDEVRSTGNHNGGHGGQHVPLHLH